VPEVELDSERPMVEGIARWDGDPRNEVGESANLGKSKVMGEDEIDVFSSGGGLKIGGAGLDLPELGLGSSGEEIE
jgi:hypothetical protein